jgi:hypothetical protein
MRPITTQPSNVETPFAIKHLKLMPSGGILMPVGGSTCFWVHLSGEAGTLI